MTNFTRLANLINELKVTRDPGTNNTKKFSSLTILWQWNKDYLLMNQSSLQRVSKTTQKNSPQRGCHFLQPSGSMSPGYVWQLYLVKNHKITNNSTTTETGEKMGHIWNPWNFRPSDATSSTITKL
jgi:hypothetical protein